MGVADRAGVGQDLTPDPFRDSRLRPSTRRENTCYVYFSFAETEILSHSLH
jgi:hypothetical protein